MSEKQIYAWIIPDDQPHFTPHEDIPEAYRVVECKEAACGIIVYAKYKDGWHANTNTRALIRHLLMRLKNE